MQMSENYLNTVDKLKQDLNIQMRILANIVLILCILSGITVVCGIILLYGLKEKEDRYISEIYCNYECSQLDCMIDAEIKGNCICLSFIINTTHIYDKYTCTYVEPVVYLTMSYLLLLIILCISLMANIMMSGYGWKHFYNAVLIRRQINNLQWDGEYEMLVTNNNSV